MTVKEMCAMLFMPKEISVGMGGREYTLKKEHDSAPNLMMMNYMENFIVEDISATGEDEFYISVQMKPVTKEDIA